MRVGVGLILFAVAVLAVQKDRLSMFERDVFRLVNDLPGAISSLVLVVMQGGNLAAEPVTAAGVLVFRAKRLALDLAVAANP